jgi:uncharacterized protein YbjT (DUF2867 family)
MTDDKKLKIKNERILILGGTGFVGRGLVGQLVKKGYKLRLLTREPLKAKSIIPENADVEIVQGDLVKNKGVKKALKGIKYAFYLVHSLGGKTIYRNIEFIKNDRAAAENFINTANTELLERVIYLGGLGELGPGLSDHLKSRAEVAQILTSGRALPTILRAAIIIGAGSTSFELIKYIVDRC